METSLTLSSIANTLVPITAAAAGWGWLAVLLAVGGLILLYRSTSKDPGYIKSIRSSPEELKDAEEPLVARRGLDSPALWAGQWSQLCPTCKTLAMGLGAIITIQRLWQDHSAPSAAGPWIRHVSFSHADALVFLVVDVFVLCSVATLATMQGFQIARNITTNEMANQHRYTYLRGPDGRFLNPFDRGCSKNCGDFLLHGVTEDVMVSWLPRNNMLVPHIQRDLGSKEGIGGVGGASAMSNGGPCAGGSGGANHGHSHAHGLTHGHSASVPMGLAVGIMRNSYSKLGRTS
ncbi:hypothetical protein CBR_g22348 [Chara braunii]|uniref:S-acyltransferase n=1 Tax=Chara braunii TaxID=69332 RepID=A0A388JUS3_CHABU|nr:hypothetical protein CBR_g22348 [Chara braunii]|eukprot:GBG61551.1 hypothetical protein CBR_g22348 [Chara braunii]